MSGDPCGAVQDLLHAALADPETEWSLGSFGALATFSRDPDEPVFALPDDRLGLATARGAVALGPTRGLRPVAYETGFASGWSHAVALCLPEGACALGRRSVVTELGPDGEAARAQDRDGMLFDLGLGLAAVDACVRASDPQVLACLRAGVGRPPFAAGNPIGPSLVAMSPHRVFRTRIGRIEVFSPVPHDGVALEGPRAHILPRILKAGLTHAATAPIPAGLVPCGALHPPHPCKDGMGRPIPFDAGRHAAFQALLDAWGDPDLLAVKRAAMAGAEIPDTEASLRHARSAWRAAEAQARCLRGEADGPGITPGGMPGSG